MRESDVNVHFFQEKKFWETERKRLEEKEQEAVAMTATWRDRTTVLETEKAAAFIAKDTVSDYRSNVLISAFCVTSVTVFIDISEWGCRRKHR